MLVIRTLIVWGLRVYNNEGLYLYSNGRMVGRSSGMLSTRVQILMLAHFLRFCRIYCDVMCNLKKKESTRTNDWCMDMDFRLVMANMHAMKLICTRSTVEM
jgi:hypothetical protein